MANPASTASVLVALSANSFVTVIKFAAFAVSGSGSMLSEAIHSLKRAGRDRDEDYHHGYGSERSTSSGGRAGWNLL